MMLTSKNIFVAVSRVFLASQSATVWSSHSRACLAVQGASVGTVAASDSRARALEVGRIRLVGRTRDGRRPASVTTTLPSW